MNSTISKTAQNNAGRRYLPWILISLPISILTLKFEEYFLYFVCAGIAAAGITYILRRIDMLSPIVFYTFAFWTVFIIGSINFDIYPALFGITKVPSYQWGYYLLSYFSVVAGYLLGGHVAKSKKKVWESGQTAAWDSKRFWPVMYLFLSIGVLFSLVFFYLQGGIPVLSPDMEAKRRIIMWKGAGFIFFNTYFINFVPSFILVYWLTQRNKIARGEKWKCFIIITLSLSIRLLFASRSQLLPFIFTFLLAYNFYVKKITLIKIIIFSLIILTVFGFIYYIREFEYIEGVGVGKEGPLIGSAVSVLFAFRQIAACLSYILENVPERFNFLGLHGIIRPFLGLLPGYGSVVVQEDQEFWGIEEQMGISGTSIGHAYRIGGPIFVVLLAFLWGVAISYLYKRLKITKTPHNLIMYSVVFMFFIWSIRGSMWILIPEAIWIFLIPYALSILLQKKKFNFAQNSLIILLVSGIFLGLVVIIRNFV